MIPRLETSWSRALAGPLSIGSTGLYNGKEQADPIDRQVDLFQDRDYPVLNEYRAVRVVCLPPFRGLSLDPVRRVFPGCPLQFLR
jgi:hypothetical protein